MEIFQRAFIVLAFILYLKLMVGVFSMQSTTQTSLLFQHSSANKSKDKFLIRKCCGQGQVYNFNWEEDVSDRKDRCVKYSITSSHDPSSTNDSQQVFFGSEQTLPPQYAIEDIEIEAGFPQNCTPDRYGSTLILLEPDMRMADLFYPIASGQLLVPHRFWVLQAEDHCIEDFFLDGNFEKARRVAFICPSHTHPFPTTATDDLGKLQLNFIRWTAPVDLSTMSGRTVIRKCCDRNEVYSQNLVCIENRGASTQFFDGLQFAKSNELFFRFGLPICTDPFRYRRQTIDFALNSNGSLEISPGTLISKSNDNLVTVEHYCMEDIVYKDSVGLPITTNLAIFCSDKVEELITKKESITPPDESTDSEAAYDMVHNESSKIITPKCCPSGYVMDEQDNTCQPLKLEDESSDADVIITRALSNYIQNYYNISSILIANSSIFCNFIKNISLKPTYHSFGKLLFESAGEENNFTALLLTHFYIENYWDLKVKHQPFCMDLALLRNAKEVFYQPQVFYCTSKSHVSIHYPILLLVSAAGLLATFLIYFFVPASGSAKLVTSGFGGGSRKRSRVQTMAMMLTGRILLCHIITLFLTFISLSIVQLELVSQGQAACIAMGYIIYFASVASFSWLTVYCFDYYRIFSGSFKVSNEILFIPYSAFGWGFPILAVVAAVVTQFQSSHLGVSEIFNPNMGLLKCWFADGTSALIFFYAPVGSLLLFDIVCFLTLLFNPNLMHCWRGKQAMTMRTNRNTSKNSKEQQDFKMALKLFFITGIPWVFEFAAWLPFYLTENSFLRTNSVYFFEISNLLNSLRGVIIFIIFIVLNRDVRRFLWPRIKRIFIREDSKIARRTRSNIEDPSFSTQSTSGVTSSTSHSFSKSEERDD